MIPKLIHQLLEKVKSGDYTQEELHDFYDWLSMPGNEEDASEYFQDIWLETLGKKQDTIDTDQEKLWNTILKKAKGGTEQPTFLKTYKRQEKSLPLWTKIAAALLPLLVITLFWLIKNPTTDNQNISQAILTKTISTPKGIKKQITLPDGSKVKLNSGSKITFNEDFLNGDDRVIYLEGEAFFDVTKLKGKRFRVKTSSSTVTVLGTSFSVKNNNSDNNGYVAVLTGKVNVISKNDKVNLLPGEMTLLGSDELKKQPFDPDEIFLWKDGVLYYHDATLDQVFQKLEYWYGVEFSLHGKKSNRTGFSGRFKGESLENILEGLSFSAGFKFAIEDQTVNIHFK